MRLKGFLSEWVDPVRLIRRSSVLSRKDVSLVGALTALTVLFEGLGVASLLPILKYVEVGGDLESLAHSSDSWGEILAFSERVGLQISLPLLSISAFVLICLRQLFAYATLVETARLTQNLERELAKKCFGGVLESRSKFIESLGSGGFVDVIYQQCQIVGKMVITYATTLRLLLTIMAYAFFMLAASPIAGVVVGIIVLVFIVGMGPLVRTVRLHSDKRVVAQREYAQYINERYRNWSSIKLGGTLPIERAHFQERTAHLFSLALSIAKASAKIQTIVIPAMTLLALAVLNFAVAVLDIQLATITLFVLMLVRLIPIAEGVVRVRQTLANSTPSLARVVNVLEEAAQEAETSKGTALCSKLSMGITFRNVSYAYPDSHHPALARINAEIPAGKVTALVGRSGAGKTTLIDLIPRLLAPSDGTVLWDGCPLEEFDLESLRAQIAVVPQSPLLLDMSVVDCVRYGKADATLGDVKAACAVAFADEFIEGLSDGYDTKVGENGARLSGGQLQRLVLARAFLQKASLILLDEPTSALDEEAERKVCEAIFNLVNSTNVTAIIIAHRLSTVKDADQFIALKDGSVSASGAASSAFLDLDWLRENGDVGFNPPAPRGNVSFESR